MSTVSYTYGDSLHADIVASEEAANAVLDAINAGKAFDALITDADRGGPDSAPTDAETVVSIRDNMYYQE